jgi:hypothetical protein
MDRKIVYVCVCVRGGRGCSLIALFSFLSLSSFDVHDDVRLTNDASKEKDESHAAKVIERRWYERNKHTFPASRWEVFDPTVKRDKYTIHDSKLEA